MKRLTDAVCVKRFPESPSWGEAELGVTQGWLGPGLVLGHSRLHERWDAVALLLKEVWILRRPSGHASTSPALNFGGSCSHKEQEIWRTRNLVLTDRQGKGVLGKEDSVSEGAGVRKYASGFLKKTSWRIITTLDTGHRNGVSQPGRAPLWSVPSGQHPFPPGTGAEIDQGTLKGRSSYVLGRAQCKGKMWGPLSKIINNVKTATADH